MTKKTKVAPATRRAVPRNDAPIVLDREVIIALRMQLRTKQLGAA